MYGKRGAKKKRVPEALKMKFAMPPFAKARAYPAGNDCKYN
jgi:hypothetical protein